MAFEAIKSSLNPYSDFKNFKSKKELEMFKKLQSLRDDYWTPAPRKLIYDHSIEQPAKILWLILHQLGWKDGHSCYSQENLAYFCGCSTRTISRYQNILVAHNYLKKFPSQEFPTEDCYTKYPPECIMPGSEKAFKLKNKPKR